MSGPSVPEFDTEAQARQWMDAQVDDSCVDNYRFAFNDDAEGVVTYNDQQNQGCCGSFDREVKVGGKLATIGCNYGH